MYKVRFTLTARKLIITVFSFLIVSIAGISLFSGASAQSKGSGKRKENIITVKTEDDNVIVIHKDREIPMDGAVNITDSTSSDVKSAIVFSDGTVLVSTRDGDDIYGRLV